MPTMTAEAVVVIHRELQSAVDVSTLLTSSLLAMES